MIHCAASRRSAYLLLPFLLVLSLCLACGRKGSPKPPEATAPSPVQFLVATGQLSSVTLSWQAPKTNAQGKDLVDLDQFVVVRDEFVRGEDPDFEEVGNVKFEGYEELPADGSPDVVQRKTKQYAFVDDKVELGKSYSYMVLPENGSGVRGQPSSVLRVRFTGETSVIDTLQ